MFKDLFAFPIYQVKIPPEFYDKRELVSKILKNYKKSPSRNEWSCMSDMHHPFNDWENPDLEKIDFSKLNKVYNETIQKFVGQLDFVQSINWKYELVNYTVTTKGQSMVEHHHMPSLFSAVHYLKFDSEKHNSTVFFNPSQYQNVFSLFYSDQIDVLSKKDIRNSWLTRYKYISVEEDDLVIFPAVLNHAISPSYNEEERVTVALNIDITKI
jgi:uncharacterized protein (TIGR02466 family)